jgi:hypothetical protein
MRDELLNETLLFSLGHTRIADWADDSNRHCPHWALRYLTLAGYADDLTATCEAP